MDRYSKSALTFNGYVLDGILRDYMTVNVEGRQLISPKLDTQLIKGRDGDVVLNQNYPPRDITVHFLLRAKNNYEFLKRIKELNSILMTNEDVEFSFDDEEGFRFGRVSEVDDPPYDSNVGIGKFTIHCQNPFIYSKSRISTGTIPKLEYKNYYVKIDSIELTTNTTSKIVVKNETRGTKIILNGSFSSGQKLFISEDKILLNGENKLMWLDFVESDFHAFKIFSQDRISVSGGNNLKIEYRERSL